MVTLRKAGLSDIPGLAEIDRFGEELNSFSGLDALDPHHEKDTGPTYCETFIRGKRKWCYLAEDDGQMVGFILFNIERRPSYYQIKEIGYIDLLRVIPGMRKKGIGRMLFEAARDVLAEEGIRYLKLSVHTDNEAREAWERIGFQEYRVDMWREV